MPHTLTQPPPPRPTVGVRRPASTRTDASARLTAAWLHVVDTPRGDYIESRPTPPASSWPGGRKISSTA